LEHIGFSGSILQWLKDFISNRNCIVRLKNTCSRQFSTLSGVPQGSHLGPVLFLLFFNDVSLAFSDVEFLIFADDVKLYKSIESISDCVILQKNLEYFHSWCTANGLQLNINKCMTISFTRSHSPILFDYNLNFTIINKVDLIMDLGVLFDCKMSFVPHISSVVMKARRALGFLTRSTVNFSNIHALKTLFITLVRSHLEYATPIWNPYYEVHINSLEKIQHKFLRIINFKLNIPLEDLDYNSLMSRLNLQLLSDRRKYFDLIFLFKILNGSIQCPELFNFLNFKIPSFNCRSKDRFVHAYHRVNYTKNNTIDRIQSIGNKFCNEIGTLDCSIKLIKNYALNL